MVLRVSGGETNVQSRISVFANARRTAPRVLVILECRESDKHVCAHAVKLVEEQGGYLTVVAVVPSDLLFLVGATFGGPQPRSRDERQKEASAAIAHAVAQTPPEIPIVTAIEDATIRKAIARQIEIAEPDIVVTRRYGGQRAKSVLADLHRGS